MINIERFVCNMFQENTFVVSDNSGECVIIDCGALHPTERMAIVEYIESDELTPVHLIDTHGHIDHHFGDYFVYKTYGLKPEVSALDQYLMEDMLAQTRRFANLDDYEEEFPSVGKYLQPDDVIKFGTHELTIIPTPGHTPGSVFFYCKEEGVAFSGDTLFHMSIGRTDFDGGSYDSMMRSLKNIANTLPPDTIIYTGHGPKTTLARELQMNPYLR
ncbi:MAG: MBL fold metallo-hydrolase [Prevotella sp.]|jgi:glyoxylase-like metal-dependent hydrolase (beta-lactamase superfamily II)|nr:MBL fold metallo-hydrolase [Prevotella sp.]